jgi:hypothetical protein
MSLARGLAEGLGLLFFIGSIFMLSQVAQAALTAA